MKQNGIIPTLAFISLAAFALVAINGCGGGGGPIGAPPTAPPSNNAAFLALLPAAQQTATYVGDSKCAACHATDSTNFSKTPMAQKSVTCESCHGPASAHVKNPQTTNILAFTNITSPVVCGQCHGSEYTDWSGSAHAQIISDAVGSDSSNCLRCHSAELRDEEIDSPIGLGQTPAQVNTAISALTTAQLTAFASATTETASCVVCHDPHQVTTNTTTDPGPYGGNQFQLRRATANTSTVGIGTGTSVGTYTTYNQLCGSCHNSRGSNSTDASLVASTSRGPSMGREMDMLLGITGAQGGTTPPQMTSSHVNAPDQCVHCHLPNASHTFTVNLDVSCAPCHTSADAAARETSVQTNTLNTLVAMQTEMQNWAQATYGSSDLWDYGTNLKAGETEPTNLPLAILRARYNYYDIITDGSYGVHNWAYTDYLLEYSQQQLTTLTPAVATPGYTVTQAKAILSPSVAATVRWAKTGGD